MQVLWGSATTTWDRCLRSRSTATRLASQLRQDRPSPTRTSVTMPTSPTYQRLWCPLVHLLVLTLQKTPRGLDRQLREIEASTDRQMDVSTSSRHNPKETDEKKKKRKDGRTYPIWRRLTDAVKRTRSHLQLPGVTNRRLLKPSYLTLSVYCSLRHEQFRKR